MPQWLQMVYRKLQEFDPMFGGDFNIEQDASEIGENANHQETTVQEHGDLQAALFDDTDNNILS